MNYNQLPNFLFHLAFSIVLYATITACGGEDSTTQPPIADTTPPVITLNGASPINLNLGETYIEQGATASDNIDQSVTVSISGNVDTNTVGNYTITYSATDSANNSSTVTRTIIVSEVGSNAAVITESNVMSIVDSLLDSTTLSISSVFKRDFDIYNVEDESYTTRSYTNCSGVAYSDYDLSDDKTFNGQTRYEDFNNCFRIELNGEAQLQGHYAFDSRSGSDRVEQISLDLDNVLAMSTEDSREFTISGQMIWTWQPSFQGSSEYRLILNTTIDDRSTGDTYRFNEFELYVSAAASVRYVNLEGRFHHSEHGYVDVSTDDSFNFEYHSMTPQSGIFSLIGDGQTADIDYSSNPVINITDN